MSGPMTGAKATAVYTMEEVAKHNSLQDLWTVIDGRVYDLTKFQKLHPGGQHILLDVAGKDGTKAFYAFHKNEVLTKYFPRLCIGQVAEAKVGTMWNPVKRLVDTSTGKLIDINDPSISLTIEQLLAHPLLSHAPFGETAAYKKYYESPYYTVGHLRFRLACREFYDEIKEEAEAAEESQEYPSNEMFLKMGKRGILACKIGVMGMPFAKKYGIPLPGGIQPDDFDFFHELIIHEEHCRLGCPGYSDGLGAGYSIGLPPIINFYQGPRREEIIREVILGEKKVVLAITGPEAGSDVANHTTTAELSADGRSYTVRGVKKWITNGMFADYFVTAVRTGGKGLKGISLLLIEKDERVQVKQLTCSYSKSAGTALVMYEDHVCPADRIMGAVNGGFKCIMLNFNHERWMIAACILGFMRLVVGDCVMWLNQRQAFGKPLMDQPVLRFKLGQMCAAMEALQSYTDYVTFNMDKYYRRMKDDPKTWANRDYLAGEIGLLKYQTTRTAHEIADGGCQLMGGRACTRTGMGKHMERFNRVYKIFSIYGGSEEIMADLGVRQGLREWSPEDRLLSKM